MSKGLKCYNCGKGIMVGHNVSHAKNRTRKVFKPNLHAARIMISGRPLRVRLCTKCLRRYKAFSSFKATIKSNNLEEKPAEKTEISSIAPAVAGLV